MWDQAKLRCFLVALAVAVAGSVTTSASANHQLKSAYLGSSVWGENLSPVQIQQQVQSHFAAAVEQLEAKNASSLLLSLRRAEATAVTPWSKAERRAALIFLAHRRQQQISRIRGYMNRGRFPLNEGQSSDVVPVFVDRHQTRCAVAHLMHSDGRDTDVASVVSEDNLVRVGNVRGGKMIEWIRSSGLTHEEVAMVQPAYPLTFDASFQSLQTQELRRDGLVISDMQVRGTRFSYDLPANIADAPQVLHEALAVGKTRLEEANVVGSLYQSTHGVIVNDGGEAAPFGIVSDYIATPDNLTDWLFFGPDSGGFSGLVGTSQAAGNVGLLSIEYTLEAESGIIDQLALTGTESPYSPHNSASGEQAAIMILSEILEPSTNDVIDTLSLSAIGGVNSPPFGFSENGLIGSQAVSVGRKSIRLNNYAIGLAGEASSSQSYIHSFFHEVNTRAIPEPSSSAMLFLALGAKLLCRVRTSFS